jgi:hypothetical protein
MVHRVPTLVIYWGDTREVLSNNDRADLFHHSNVESVDFNEVLLRHWPTGRLVVVRGLGEKGLHCSLCSTELVEDHFGGECIRLGKCVLTGEDSTLKPRVG